MFSLLSASANIFKIMSASAAIAIERERKCKIGERVQVCDQLCVL